MVLFFYFFLSREVANGFLEAHRRAPLIFDAGATPPAVVRTIPSIGAQWDMFWDAPCSRLLVLAGYRLYRRGSSRGSERPREILRQPK